MRRRVSPYERKIFRGAVAAAVGLHLGVILALLAAGGYSSESNYKPLAVMDFAYYDPEGGDPGGGEGEEPSTGPAPEEPTLPAEIAEPEPEEFEPPPEPEPVMEPEPEMEPLEIELPEVLTSVSEEAAPLPAPPPVVEEAEAKPKKPRPAPRAAPTPAPDQSAVRRKAGGGGSGGTLPGEEVRPGGGLGTGLGGLGGGTGMGNPNALEAYKAKIRAKLNRLKKYPPAASAQRIGGVVTVNFTVNRGGEVVSSRLVKSSGQALLDQEALALLKRCSPFPSMPKDLTLETLNLTVPVDFSLPKR